VNAYRLMWLFVMFDVPVGTRNERKRYVVFRNALLRRAFSMLQLSVYARCYANEDGARAAREQLKFFVPKRGKVRFLSVTDHQFGKMESFFGKSIQDVEQPLDQLVLF
jgi:CRISPR-associated protein Cas2